MSDDVIADIQAVADDVEISPAETRSEIERLRAQAHLDALQSALPLTLDDIIVTNASLGMSDRSDGSTEYSLRLEGVGGSPLLWPIVVVNPPLLIRDDEGDVVLDGETYRFDPLEIIQSVIADSMIAAQTASS